eukprot:361614-Chlamydomonas_euryale.AAC.1
MSDTDSTRRPCARSCGERRGAEREQQDGIGAGRHRCGTAQERPAAALHSCTCVWVHGCAMTACVLQHECCCCCCCCCVAVLLLLLLLLCMCVHA